MSLIISAPKSNSGKTLLTLLLTSWIKCNSENIQTFKIGPDYLDSQLHSAVSQLPCRNLDLHLTNYNWVIQSFFGHSSNVDYSIIEGVMGLYDGIGASSIGSTADIAIKLNIPVILIIDANGQAASVGALIRGFQNYDKKLDIAGVVFNNVRNKLHKNLLLEIVNSINIKMLGALPYNENFILPKRHLGLLPSHEIIGINLKIKEWAKLASMYLDMSTFRVLLKSKLGNNNNKTPLDEFKNSINFKKSSKNIQIAIAHDKAFHFNYPETREYMDALGINLLDWKPTENEEIPGSAQGLMIPGGFPEVFASEISSSEKSFKSLRNFFRKKPIYAECGGMLLLGNFLTDLKGKKYKMAGIIPIDASRGRLKIGYKTMIANCDSLLLKKGDQVKGHEFHYWDIKESNNNNLNEVFTPLWNTYKWDLKNEMEGFSSHKFHASWIHLFWPSHPNVMKNWYLNLNNN